MLQTQLAEKAGVKVTDKMLDNALSGIARQNGMDLISNCHDFICQFTFQNNIVFYNSHNPIQVLHS
jgi:hypothetical protein